ncbi:DeoR/GlpR family DNA-binding transcription regulator [Pseudorhodobacter wandonensis]|jgi:DeoR family glycerol-3-phosphate regulon repressor|uniref:DeoR/GlpR family DNA-binding transcription regulator n=1 Tax=Pseudorhodobacter wandonensis TaxID=1120568 RepID=UPI00067C0336|nr:DeoR/GlpR family DNA-binding transcription regulator [Pseudorhodobacter wandonensis]
MLSKRHTEILKILDEKGTVTISALAKAMDVSLETIRRDVRPLVDGGAVLRMHGAISLSSQAGEAPFRRRMRENAAAKQAIAAAAAATIRHGDAVMMDTGTTTSFLARALTGHKQLTIITNSTDVARTLAMGDGNRVFLAGGQIIGDSGAVLGAQAVRFVNGFSAAHAFISAGAVDGNEVMDYEESEVEFARALLSRADQRVLITDASKFGRRGLVTVCEFDGLDALITDAKVSAEIMGGLRQAGVKLTVASGSNPAETHQ